jgi:hypothetical protein
MNASNTIPELANAGAISQSLTPFAPGAVTNLSGAAAGFGPTAPGLQAGAAAGKPWLTPERALMASALLGGIGGHPQQQAVPVDFGGAPRSPLTTQAEITKNWLRINDPATYARLYGAPQGAQYG